MKSNTSKPKQKVRYKNLPVITNVIDQEPEKLYLTPDQEIDAALKDFMDAFNDITQHGNLEKEIDNREREIFYLKKEIEAMKKYFDIRSEPLIKKAVLNVVKTLRHFPREAQQFDDDSKLNFFEEVCVMIQEGSIDDYLLVRSTIESCCEDTCDIFNQEENFVLNNRTDTHIREVWEIIADAFFEYAGNYENKKITEAYYQRN